MDLTHKDENTESTEERTIMMDKSASYRRSAERRFI